jgi:hypothetical protein
MSEPTAPDPESLRLAEDRERKRNWKRFHGDLGVGIGASHQTGWTGLVAKLLQQSGE